MRANEDGQARRILPRIGARTLRYNQCLSPGDEHSPVLQRLFL